MAKAKTSATGRGYLGEIMMHRISREVGLVENVVEAQAGWPPQITLRLKSGGVKKGKLSDFKETSADQKRAFEAADAPPSAQAESHDQNAG